MEITGHSVEKIEDTTGILVGERYDFTLEIVVPEEDELYNENGLNLRIVVAIDDKSARIAQYQFFVQNTNKYLDFALEEEEEELVLNYCQEQIANNG